MKIAPREVFEKSICVLIIFFLNLKVFIKELPQQEELEKDTQFAAVKLPKCLEGPHNTYDRSTNSNRMQHRSRSNSRDGHSSTHDTREGSSQKRIHGATINCTPSPLYERG